MSKELLSKRAETFLQGSDRGWILAGIQELEGQLDTMLALFGDYDFHPTVEQCQKFWNHLMEERRQLKDKNKRLWERLHLAINLDIPKKVKRITPDIVPLDDGGFAQKAQKPSEVNDE